MADTEPLATTHDAERLFRLLLKKVGLSHVTCLACARALLPVPFNWESFTYTATTGQSWTWDIDCARAFSRDRGLSGRVLLDEADLLAVLKRQCRVDENHLQHIPADRLEEPVLLAPVPDGQGHALIDGSHRATVRLRAGLAVHGILLTSAESMLAIEVAPLAMQHVARELRRQRLLPIDLT